MGYTKEQIRFERLSEEHLKIIQDFKCSDNDLSDFLVEDALENQQKGVSVTYLCFLSKDDLLVGYITVLTDAISLNGELRSYFQTIGLSYKSLPALKIGRLAVHKDYMKKGIGSYMIDLSFAILEKIFTGCAGCRFITVDAKLYKNQTWNTLQFYRKKGFNILRERNRKDSVPMYLDVWVKGKYSNS